MKKEEVQDADIANWWRSESALDHADHDKTTKSILEVVPKASFIAPSFQLTAKQNGIVSGTKILKWLQANQVGWKFAKLPQDGAFVEKDEVIAVGNAPIMALLAHERIILNMLQHLGGIAMQTRGILQSLKGAWKFQEPLPGIYHTRKFIPGIRKFQAEAVVHGGGRLHRLDLSDRILFKDNHKEILRSQGSSLDEYFKHLQKTGDIGTALIEVDTVDEGLEAVKGGVRSILLDNFSPEMIQQFFLGVTEHDDIEIELSGNLTPERLPKLLIDRRIRRLSFGSLTHSVRAMDISLEIQL